MAEYRKERFYWLKLKRDFFKRHDIKIIEAMDNGKDYLLFYLKLLLESIDHEGELRFSDTIPYNDKMLATVTDTNIDVVRAAMQVFTELGMVEILDDKTIYMREVENMIGSQTYGAAKKQQQLKTRSEQALLTEGGQRVEKRPPEIELELELDIEKEKDIEKPKRKRFTPPTIEEVAAYCEERGNSVDPQRFIDHYTSQGWMVGKNKMKDWKAAVRTWEGNSFDKKKTSKPAYKPTDETEWQF